MSEDGTESCPNGHYSYSHSYGNYQEMYDVEGQGFNTLQLAWGYKDTNHVIREVIVNAFLEYAKQTREVKNGS